MRVSELWSDLQALRVILADDLQMISRDEPLIDSLATEEARAVITEIIDARKNHVAMLNDVIAQLDPKQAEANRAVSATH